MPQTVVIEGVTPAATTWTDLYTAPTGRRARIIIRAANRDASAASEVRIALSDEGAAIADAQWVLVDDLAALDCVKETVILDAGDVVRVYTVNATVTFTANGLEEDEPS